MNLSGDIPHLVTTELLAPHAALPMQRCVGGLSQAQVFQCSSPSGPLCLRRWPAGYNVSQLQSIVRATQIARQAELSFVPLYLPSASGGVFVLAGGHHWELTQWMPGAADYLENPSLPRLEAALTALGKLHRCWSANAVRGISPAATRRARLLADYLRPQTQAEWFASLHDLRQPVLRGLTLATLEHLERLGPLWLRQIRELESRTTPVHFCLRDVWSDHILFTEEAVTGVIDYGAAQVDEPATDVARLLSSLEPSSAGKRAMGLAAYRAWQAEIDSDRVDVLDRVSCLLSAIQWLCWLVVERRQFPVAEQVLVDRWQGFVKRLDNW